MKGAIQQTKVANKKISENRSEENMVRHKNIKNRTKKLVASFTRKEAEKELTKLNKNQITFLHLKFMNEDRKDIARGRCMGRKGRKFRLQ